MFSAENIAVTDRFFLQRFTVVIIFLLSIPMLMAGQGRVAEEEFGKTRVQYHDDFNNWWRYESQNVITYWYGKGRNIAEGVFQLAEYDYEEIQNTLQHRLNEKLEIIVYTDITDLKQSNIGSEEQFETEPGKTKLVENKIFVYFNGSHRDLRRQVREGISRAFIDQMIFGSNIQEMIQSAVSVDFPEWFKEGLIQHIGDRWNYSDDARLRDHFYHKDIEDFDELIFQSPELAGKAFWHYLVLHYGHSTIANLLYLTRINRNLDNGFLFVLGKPFSTLKSESYNYFNGVYQAERAQFSADLNWEPLPGFSNRRSAVISDIKIKPDQTAVVYNENEIGRNRVFLHDLHTGERNVIFREGFRNPFQDPDYNYPMLSWSPDGNRLMILYEQRDVIKLREYDFTRDDYREQEINPIFQRVYSFDYYDERTLVMAAKTDGFSDIYMYDISTRQSNRITHDIFDHKWVSRYQGEDKNGIVFSSNRPGTELERIRRDTVLPLGHLDLFFTDPESGDRERTAERLTRGHLSDQSLIRQSGELSFLFLSDYHGVKNIYRWSPDFSHESTLSPDGLAITHSSSGVQTFDYVGNLLVAVKREADVSRVFISDLSDATAFKPYRTTLRAKKIGIKQEELPVQKKSTDSLQPIPEEYKFHTRFEDPESLPFSRDALTGRSEHPLRSRVIPPTDESGKTVLPFRSARAIASRLHFRFEEVSTSLDNSLLFSGLDAYAGVQQGFEFPPMGLLIKSKVFDIFEDYVFEGGVRIQTDFNGAEYYLTFDDKKTRWNKRYAFYWRSRSERETTRLGSFEQLKNTTAILQNRWTYPFDLFRSVRFTGTVRLDRFIFQSTTLETLQEPDFNRQSFGLRAEYIYDNSYDVLTNIKNGTRYKFYIEGVNQFRVQFSPWAFDASSGFMTVIGFDARHYQRLFNQAILAVRGAGATTMGSERILFYMGGVENPLNTKFNQNIPVPDDERFAYQALALNMRGFHQNIRNGSSFLVSNIELRLPIFHFFTKGPVRSDFLSAFQVVGFFDIGYTWYGTDPFGGQNPLNRVTVSNPVSSAEVEYFRDPVVMGMGAGIRATLFGYFIRLDRGWGIETRQIQPPVWHLSLGYDF